MRRTKDSSGLLMIVVAVVSLVVGATLASLFGGKSVASSTDGNVEEAVQKVLENNPQLIVDAFQKGRAKQQQQQQADAGKNISANLDKLEKNDKAPFIGNAKGDVVVVEFFDYSCGYCKRVIGDVAKLVDEDKNIKFVFKELPILGPGSEIASRAALATYVIQPDKYFAIHRALMEFQGQKSDETVMDIVKKLGLDVANIKEEMKSSKVSELLKANRDLAQSIGVNGTPAFIIGGKLNPGAMDINAMKAAIAEARKK
jgi:protein-disulfide isomerase